MHHAETTREKVRLFLNIMWPILVTQVGYHAMNLTDTIMAGRAGTADLAGVAIGGSLWMPAFVALSGVLLAVTPVVSQLTGAGRADRIAPTVTQAAYLSLALSAMVFVLGALLVDPVLTMMRLDPEVHGIAKEYLVGLSYGLIPLFLSSVVRNYFDAQGRTNVTMAIVLFALPCNVFLNYVLIFGKLGFPELGGAGTGYATAATYWIILAISLWLVFRLETPKQQRLFRVWPRPSASAVRELLKIGVPIGLSIFFEASIFSVVTLLMGSAFDTVTIASHQAAISFAGMMFMMPLSISMALTILVGYEIGAGRPNHAGRYARIGVTSAVGIIAVAALLLYFTRAYVASWFTDAPDVAAMTQQFLIFVIFFQLSDAAQASLQGALRGYKDVTVPFVTALVAYWAIGIPAGYALSWTALGPFGYWVGITAGLTCAAIGFGVRLRIVQRRIKRQRTAS
ncbi:MATE family efflux transporter [Paenibacillus sp.]|uniref:MATE family efflux transporter n=1 Tax=Paenibacillus sp. TaxID=58172 RepID=UPI002D508E9E|nr:MATE family efflux transporter [Paenibacillus sp.]HZG85040.1 MATE family efflux transporter [Paenibacillus sp.]